MEHQKNSSQSRSPVSFQSSRARTEKKPRNRKKTEISVSNPTDTESFSFSYELGVSVLLQDRSPSRQVSGAFSRILRNVLDSGDLLGFIAACTELRGGLVTSGDWVTNPSKDSKLRWVRGLVLAIQHAIPGSLIVHPSIEFNRVATFLGWLKRLPVCIRDTRESIDEYYSCDRRISSLNFDESPYVPMLREIWTEWFGEFRITKPFSPRHGSGSTADAGRIRHDKWRKLSADDVAHVCMRYPDLTSALDTLPRRPCSRTSKVVFVPKQAGRDRTICMEPAWLQYLQQGIARQIVAFTHSTHHPLHRLVDIFSQENNRRLCAWAWADGYATIDLSDASDSVSVRLIKALCGHLPLWRYLYASRSTTTSIDGRVVEMDKYAPMGSALCFPIECYVFASIVELAHRIHYGQASRGAASGCSVYGDDIVCPAEIYHLMEDILQNLGFIVNVTKSFSSGDYYESCGVEYLQGVRIVTIKHPRNHLSCREVVSPDAIGLVTDLANSLYEFGAFDARRMLLKEYEGVYVAVDSRLVPFMDLVRFGDRWLKPVVEPYERTYYDSNYQRRYELHKVLSSSPICAESDFLEWKSKHPARSREERLRGLYDVIDTSYDPKLSRKGVIALARMGCYDILRGDDDQVVGQHKTGRLRTRVSSQKDMRRGR